MKHVRDNKRQRTDSVNRLAVEFGKSCKRAEKQIADELPFYKWDELAHNFDGETTQRLH